MKLFITSPHSVCSVQPAKFDSNDKIKKLIAKHPCDKHADLAANTLYEYLQKNTKNLCELLQATHSRIQHDHNRDPKKQETQDTEFLNEFKSKLPGTDIHLDIHSYPGLEGLTGEKDDVYIIDVSGYSREGKTREKNKWLVTSLKLYLLSKNIKCSVYVSNAFNFLSIGAIENNINSLLIEFNEKLSEEKVKNICEITGEWLS